MTDFNPEIDRFSVGNYIFVSKNWYFGPKMAVFLQKYISLPGASS